MVGHVEREGHRLVHGLHVVVHARLDLFGHGVDVRHGDDVRIRARRVDVAVEHRALRRLTGGVDRGCVFNSFPTDTSIVADLPIGCICIGNNNHVFLIRQTGLTLQNPFVYKVFRG